MSNGIKSIAISEIGNMLVRMFAQAAGHEEVGLVMFVHDNQSGEVISTTNLEPEGFHDFMGFISKETRQANYSMEATEFPPEVKH